MADAIKKDLVIVGGGPAGLSAAIYAERSLLDTVTIEREAVGGQVILTSEVDNYPGVPNTDGFSLVDAMQKQAEGLGATITMDTVTKIDLLESGEYLVQTSNEKFETKSLIIAGGATPRLAGFAGEKDFYGHGVSYCATCDGMFYRGKTVYVIGGGNSAAEEALFLTKFASKVYMVVRKDHLRAQAVVGKQVEENEKIEVLYNTTVESVSGEGLLNQIVLRDVNSGELTTETYDNGAFGVFVFVGRVPASELVRDLVDMDDAGYVITNERMETKTPGLFVAGDIRQKPLRQIVTAASDGAVAATSAASYLGRPIEG